MSITSMLPGGIEIGNLYVYNKQGDSPIMLALIYSLYNELIKI